MKKDRIDVSCVINGHQESHVIAATINSVLRTVEYAKCCGIRVEVIVVLDDPDDDTASVVNNFSNEKIAIHTVFYKDLGLSRNYAVEQSRGKYVSFIDGDDLWCKTWISNSFQMASSRIPSVLHPEYNIYFGSSDPHVLHHVDMDDGDYLEEAISRENYWTALAFSERSIYEKYLYRNNEINAGFGYEDWTWNVATINGGIKHHVVKGTCHFIRRTAGSSSLLNLTNSSSAIPRILPIYNEDGSENTRKRDSDEFSSVKLNEL